MDLSLYGVIIKRFDNPSKLAAHVRESLSPSIRLAVTIMEEGVYRKIDMIDKSGKILCSFWDEKFEKFFIRAVFDKNLKNPIYFKYDFNLNLLLMEFDCNNSFIDILKKDTQHNTNFLTFDIETYLDSNNNSIPYACGFYDGEVCQSYYLTDFSSPTNMLLKCLEDMMSVKYKGYIVYAHNLSNFDAIF